MCIQSTKHTYIYYTCISILDESMHRQNKNCAFPGQWWSPCISRSQVEQRKSHIYLKEACKEYIPDWFALSSERVQAKKHRSSRGPSQRSNHGEYRSSAVSLFLLLLSLLSLISLLNYFGSAKICKKNLRIVQKWYRCQPATVTGILCVYKNIYVGAMCDLFKVPHIYWNTW